MIAALVVAAVAGFGGGPGETPRELIPGVRVGDGIVEFRGTVCADASHPQTPVVYLELLVTGPDSREHESLVVTSVKPSAIHAGLLAAGFEPGHPVRIEDGQRAAPIGDRLRVEVAVIEQQGEPGPFVPLSDWSVEVRDDGDASTPTRLTHAAGWGLVFAGSLLGEDGYAADHTGTIIGLTGFGTEVVAAAWTLSPWVAQDAPVWIVDAERVAPFGAEVVIRVSGPDQDRAASDQPHQQDAEGASVDNDPDASGP